MKRDAYFKVKKIKQPLAQRKVTIQRWPKGQEVLVPSRK